MADLLTIRDLRVYLDVDAGIVKAVDGVSFRIPERGTVALVGESGSGKSVVAQSIMGILPRIARIESGEIVLRDPQSGDEVDVSRLDPAGPQMQAIRGGRMSIIFQEPMTALSPVHTVGNQVGEALALHRLDLGKGERREAVIEMLRLVGFPDPVKAEHTYPFELSGGLRQRAMIAMALVCRPALLIADEPTTALDVTIQSQIVAQMQALCAEAGTALIWITHDLALISGFADRVAVMYAGRIVEQGPVDAVLAAPFHPYTHGLIGSLPGGGSPGAPLDQIPGLPPSPVNLPPGCAFAPRCPRADAACTAAPDNTAHPGGRAVRCWHPHAALEPVG